MCPDIPALTGVILAGGLARRMNGQDKGLIRLAGRPMIEYVITSLSSQVAGIYINANRNFNDYRQYGYPVVPDRHVDHAGPLAGIAAGIAMAETDLVLTAPCDGPWLPTDLADRLYRQMLASGADICVANDGRRMQPVFGLFHRRVLKAINDYLDAGERKLQSWVETQNYAFADYSDRPEAFVNVNTPEEQQRVETLLQSGGR